VSLNAAALFAAVTSKAQALGIFDAVAGHEPVSPPPETGLYAAAWASDLTTVPRRSGQATTSARLEITIRVYRNAGQVTLIDGDSVDPAILDAVDQLIGALIGDFDLGEGVELDVLGAHGAGIGAKAGWMRQDTAQVRVMDVTVPIISDDLWPQTR
jgi:hypothetical protein